MDKSQILFYLIIMFLLGVFVASFLVVSETWILILLVLAIGTIAISGYSPRTKSAPSGGGQRNYLVRGRKIYSKQGLLAGALALVFIFGIIRFNSFNFANSILNQFADIEVGERGIEITLNGYIDDEPDISGLNSQFIFKVKELISGDKIIDVDERTLVQTNSFPKHQFGDRLSIAGSLQTPQNFKDFDYVQYLKNKDIRTIMAFPKITDNSGMALNLVSRIKIGLYRKIFSLKELFENSVNRSLPEPYSAYINGILLGSRQDIPQSIKDSFNRTSTTHILAISGYNITIIAEALLMALVSMMRRRRAFWVSVAVIILFTILTGASASVVRAAIMGLLLLFANGYGRLYDARNGIALAAGLMVFFNPFILIFDIGFQLSFLAVIGLMCFYPILDKKFKNIPNAAGLKETALMTIAAQFLVFPLILYYFHQFSLVSLPANILVLPLMPLTMFFGFLMGVGGLIFAPLGHAVGLFTLALGFYQLGVIKWFGSLSFASLNITISWAVLLVVYCFVVYSIWKLSRIKP